MVARLRDLGLPGRDRAHVPRARALEPAPPLLAAAPRRRAAAGAAGLQGADHRAARAPAPGPLPVHARQGPRGRDRVGEVPAHRPGATTSAQRGRPRAADPRRPVRPHLRRATSARRRAPNRIDFDDLLAARRSTCSRTTRRPPRPSAPASAGSAWTSTRTRTRSSSGSSSCGWAIAATCASWATRTRRSTRSPGRRRRSSPRSRSAGRARGWSRSCGTTAPRPRCWTLANRLIAAEGRTKRLVATRGDGPLPTISRHPSADAGAGGARRLDPRPAGRGDRARGDRGPRADERAARPDRGGADPGRRRVPGPRAALLRPAGGARRAGEPPAPADRGRRRRTSRTRSGPAGRRPSGYEEDGTAEGDEARERQASLETLLAIVDGVAAADPAADAATVIADLEARAAHEREGAADGVNLLTYHRAKGLEWDAVFLPSLEEGILPIRQAKDDDDGARRGAPPPVRRASRGPACTSRSRGRSGARPAAARRAASPAGSCWTSGRGPGSRITQLAGPPPAERVAAAQRLGRPGVRGAPRVADGEGARGGDAAVRHRPRRDARSRSRRPARARWPRCAASRAWAPPSSRSTATRSSP